MARRSDNLIRVYTRGAGDEKQLARNFSRAQRRIQDQVNHTMRRLDSELGPIYRAHAPVDTGEMLRNIDSKVHFRASRVGVTVSVRAVRDGFDYLPLTRFGHRIKVVYPRKAKVLTVHVNGRYSAPILRRSVRGSTVRRDWVQTASRAALVNVERHTKELGRQIEVVMLAAGRGR